MEKTKIVCWVFLCGIFFWLLPSTGEAVDVNCSSQSLQTAINTNPAETTFNVTGTCNENITFWEMKEGITINGGGTAIIHGTDTANPTVYVWAQGVRITAVTITGGYDGIIVLRGGTATIDNHLLKGGYGPWKRQKWCTALFCLDYSSRFCRRQGKPKLL